MSNQVRVGKVGIKYPNYADGYMVGRTECGNVGLTLITADETPVATIVMTPDMAIDLIAAVNETLAGIRKRMI